MVGEVNPTPPNEAFLLNPKRAVDYLRFLYVQRVAGFTIADAPEFEPECTAFFVERLKAAGSYLEFGSGGSTVLAAKLDIPFVTVESDNVFLNAVRERVRAVGAFNAERQTYIHVHIGLTQAWGKPLVQRPSPERLARWRGYPHAPWDAFAALPGPHLILVDGRFRVAAALLAAKFLRDRAGEILFDDYRDRPHYHVAERHIEVRQCVGRMAVLRPRADPDMDALAADVERFGRDWR